MLLYRKQILLTLFRYLLPIGGPAPGRRCESNLRRSRKAVRIPAALLLKFPRTQKGARPAGTFRDRERPLFHAETLLLRLSGLAESPQCPQWLVLLDITTNWFHLGGDIGMFRVRQVDAYCPTNGVQFRSPGALFIPEGLEKTIVRKFSHSACQSTSAP